MLSIYGKVEAGAHRELISRYQFYQFQFALFTFSPQQPRDSFSLVIYLQLSKDVLGMGLDRF